MYPHKFWFEIFAVWVTIPMTSSNLGPFFHSQTLINWKCSNFFKNQYFSTKFGQKMYFHVWNSLKIKKWQFSQKSPIFSDFPENSDFGPFLSQNSRSGNILDAFKLNDNASATLYLSFSINYKALPVLVLKIWLILEAPDSTDFGKIFQKSSSAIQRYYTFNFVVNKRLDPILDILWYFKGRKWIFRSFAEVYTRKILWNFWKIKTKAFFKNGVFYDNLNGVSICSFWYTSTVTTYILFLRLGYCFLACRIKKTIHVFSKIWRFAKVYTRET